MSNLKVEQLIIANLNPCNFELRAGECASLTGPSGCGKSLLLRAIADIDPSGGEVFLDGEPRSTVPAHVWRRRVCLVAAESRWWLNTVAEHFRDPAAVDVTALGFERDVMTWRVGRLSTGEKQRLSILRSLAVSPQVILLDEPTASVDDRNAARIEALILTQRQQRNCSVMWVTHDPDQAGHVASRHFEISNRTLAEAL